MASVFGDDHIGLAGIGSDDPRKEADIKPGIIGIAESAEPAERARSIGGTDGVGLGAIPADEVLDRLEIRKIATRLVRRSRRHSQGAREHETQDGAPHAPLRTTARLLRRQPVAKYDSSDIFVMGPGR
jgi:hypothetical protein